MELQDPVRDDAVWRVKGHEISLSKPVIMGILNVTPDSFSDGGRYVDADSAIAAGREMAGAGAAIVDVGGESTRPYSDPVSADEERARVLPVIAGLASEGIAVSVDTSKPEVARDAIAAGASIVNDVTGLRNADMASACAEFGVGVVIMHMQGDPKTMQDDPTYGNVVAEVAAYLAAQSRVALESGIPIEAIAIDPGIGFGKTLEHNLDLLRHLDAFTHLGYPVLVGTSRKGFLGKLLEAHRGETSPAERDHATAATMAAAVLRGASILRVHNVPLAVDVATTATAMVR